MGKSKHKPDTRGPLQRLIDKQVAANDQSKLLVLTPEQLASGDYDTMSGAKSGQRYFRTSHLDRLHRNGKLTWEQRQAGDWYRTKWAESRYDAVRTPNWEQEVWCSGASEIALYDASMAAREAFRRARGEIPADLVGFMDRLLLKDEWPQARQQRARNSYLTMTRNGLDALCRHLRYVH